MIVTDNDEIQYHLAFPLPYRALLLLGLGILGWAINLHGLDAFGIDAVAAMELRTENKPLRPLMPVHHSPTSSHFKAVVLYHSSYRIFFLYSSFCFLSWSLYRLVTHGDRLLVDRYGYIPVTTAVTILLILLCPYNVMMKSERDNFISTIRRCVFPSPAGPIYFSDVIFADIGTSFAKVIGDLWLSLWMLKPGNSILIPPIEDGWLRWVFPAVMSFPFFIRFRQCMIEYGLPGNDSQKPLFNALKYATSFPVIFLSAAQRLVISDLAKEKGSKVAGEPWHGEHPLFRLWLLAAILNSLYSFWWDVTNDWGLELLKIDDSNGFPQQFPGPSHHVRSASLHSLHFPPSPSEENRKSIQTNTHHRHRQSCIGLRPTLLYPRAVYPILIFLNLLLRMTWSIKLSTHVHLSRDGSVAFFWLEVAELVRRWLWVFVRVEWEVLKKAQHIVPTILLDESGDDSDYEIVPNAIGN